MKPSNEMENSWALIVDLKGKSAAQVDLEMVAKVVENFAANLLKTRQSVSMQGVKGAPDWFGFETDLWDVSEEIRPFYKRNTNLRGANPLTDSLARLAGDKRYGKGRQNLVLMLGEYGRGEYSNVLGQLLDDPDVYGHAIKSLNRGKIKGYQQQIKSILDREKTAWIKNAARRYLALSGNE